MLLPIQLVPEPLILSSNWSLKHGPISPVLIDEAVTLQPARAGRKSSPPAALASVSSERVAPRTLCNRTCSDTL